MDNVVYAIYICMMVPMIMSLALLQYKAKLVMGFVLIGCTICLVASELNGVLYPYFDDMISFCTTISPITEEVLKALPILYFAFVISDNQNNLIQLAFAVGLGFAIMENMIVLVQNLSDINIVWALVRGFGAGLMHGVCTMFVGLGIALVHKKKKLFVCGTTALLMLAMTYHAIYNTIVMSDYKYCGVVLPLLAYIPINRAARRNRRKRKEAAAAAAAAADGNVTE